MKKNELKKIIREELMKEENNKFGKLEVSRSKKYKFYTQPDKYLVKTLLTKVTADLMKAIKTGEGRAIDNAFDDLQSTYGYYFMVK